MKIFFLVIWLSISSKNVQCFEDGDFKLHSEAPFKTISKYSMYRDVSIINFVVPENTKVAKFSFKAIEQKCEPKAITVHVKAASFPVISPQNISFPSDYLSDDLRYPIYNASLMSDFIAKDIYVEGPIPGNWFAIAFKNWTDPKNERIEQQGLAGKSCVTRLKADLFTIPFEPILLNANEEIQDFIDEKEAYQIYSISIPDRVDNASISIKTMNLPKTISKLNLYIRAKAYPSETNYDSKYEISPEIATENNFNFEVSSNAWHYILLEAISSSNSTFKLEYSLSVNYNFISNFSSENDYGFQISHFRNIEFFETIRINYRDFFLFDVEVCDKNGVSTDFVNFTSGINYGFRFNIYDTQDIGGMLTIFLSLINSSKNTNVEKASQRLIEDSEDTLKSNSIYAQKLVSETVPEKNFTITKLTIICVKLNEPGIPELPGNCRYGNHLYKASGVISSKNRTSFINVPFPEAGQWFITSKLFCFLDEGADIQSLNNQVDCNGTFLIGIGSIPCEPEQCGPFGNCYHYMSGGFVYTTCVCKNGYRGWDCTDGSDVNSFGLILLSTLLLTLSNLLFIPSVYFAIKRHYYTEGLIYFCAMFFSSFYHACDSGEDIYSFCLVRLGVLQFCDFYCGLLAIWVTLIAMANLRPQYVSLAHMLGAVALAFGTEYDKQSLTVFLAPAITGICIISICWAYKCRQTKAIYPSKKYLTIFLPIGAVLVMFGLICYAFLQTNQNYYIIHSVWHMVMALSILCLLPQRDWFLPS